MTFPEDRPSVPVYQGWLQGAGIAPDICRLGDPYPGVAGYDALLLPGGGDVNPVRYGAALRHLSTYGVNDAMDERDLALIHDFLAARKPVFGICRGQQILNVALGGHLIQHIPDFLGSEEECHRQKDSYDSVHPLLAQWPEGLGRVLQAVRQVNSAHHQAIDPTALGRGLRVVAASPQGIVEAIESTDRNHVISAVQWHPERLPPEQTASRGLLEYWKSLV